MDHNFYKVWYQHSKRVWWVNMHTFVANFLRYVTSKNYLNWIIFSQVFVKVKRVTFFWDTVYILHCVLIKLKKLLWLVLFLQPGPKWTWLPVMLRVVFIPFFMFCNVKPDKRKLPVLFANDYLYCIGGILMALSSGYFSSLTMMFAPRLLCFNFTFTLHFVHK